MENIMQNKKYSYNFNLINQSRAIRERERVKSLRDFHLNFIKSFNKSAVFKQCFFCVQKLCLSQFIYQF